jgi:O-antigen ligase
MRAAMLLLLVSLIAAGTIWVGGDRLVSSFSHASTDFIENPADQRSGVSRNEIWRATWKMFSAHPILGVGLGGYWVAITAYHDASGVSTPQEAHNDYLELLSSGGVIGLAIGIWFGVALFQRVRDNLRSDNHFQRSICLAALLGITGVAVHSLVDFGLHLLVNAFVFMALIMLATKRIPVES